MWACGVACTRFSGAATAQSDRLASGRLLRSKLGGLAGEAPDVGIVDSCDCCDLGGRQQRVSIGGWARCSTSSTSSSDTRTTYLEELLAGVRVLADENEESRYL